MQRLAAALVIVVCWTASARAQVPDAQGKCEQSSGTCGDASSSSSSPTDSQPYVSDAAEFKQIDEENRRRAEELLQQRKVRSFNVKGIAYFQAQDWLKAAEEFEAALALDPNNSLLQSNLVRARHERENAMMRRTAPIHVAPKPLTVTSVVISARLSAANPVPPPPIQDWPNMPPRFEAAKAQVEQSGVSFQSAAADAKDFTHHAGLFITGARIPTGSTMVSIYEAISDAKETSGKFNQLVTNLVGEAMGAAHETASILGGGDGSAEHVQETTQRMQALVNQFVEERLQSQLWGKIKEWGNARVNGIVEGMTTP